MAYGRKNRYFTVTVVVLGISTISGCTGRDFHDLDAFIQETKARPAGRIKPVPEFKSYTVYPYTAAGERDPFEPMVNEAEMATSEAVATGITPPDPDRNRESLESYPLDTLKYVGSLELAGETWVIITSPDDLVHRVTVGNYIGQNNGRIIHIDETSINIIEKVPGTLGGWVEREAALSIIEE